MVGSLLAPGFAVLSNDDNWLESRAFNLFLTMIFTI